MSDAENIPGEYFQGAKRKNSRKDVIEMLTIKLLTASKFSTLFIFITAFPRESLATLFIFSLMNSAFGYAFLEKIKNLQSVSSDLLAKNVQSRDL